MNVSVATDTYLGLTFDILLLEQFVHVLQLLLPLLRKRLLLLLRTLDPFQRVVYVGCGFWVSKGSTFQRCIEFTFVLYPALRVYKQKL